MTGVETKKGNRDMTRGILAPGGKRNYIQERKAMAFITVIDAVGVEQTVNIDNIVALKDFKKAQEILCVDGTKINLKAEDAIKVKEILLSIK
jgi:hypothetical protein